MRLAVSASKLAVPVASPRRPGTWCRATRPHVQPASSRTASALAAAGTAVAQPTPADPAPPNDVWAAFAEAVSGEWEGVTASFDQHGEPLPLPEYYVPQAYRDWGVELFDWQSQSSMLAGDGGLTATSRRMMPTVGCEADAIAFTQAAAQLFAGGGSSATVAPDGSYAHAPTDVRSPDCRKAAVETCLVLARRERRLRIVHNLRRRASDDGWALDSVELHHERWDSPHRGKLELCGCGGGMKGFAGGERLAPDALAGGWTATGVRFSGGAASGEPVSGEAWSADGLREGLLLHPLQAWSRCEIQGEDVSMAAGVLLEGQGGGMVVATCTLTAGHPAVELLTLARTA